MTNRITVAENAGFCFGVRRATDLIEREIASGSRTRLFTLGKLIHNDTYNARLEAAGVRTTTVEEIEAVAASCAAEGEARVFVRAHGMTRQTEETLTRCAASYPGFSFTDCTCPYVKKIHRIAAENSGPDEEGRERLLDLLFASGRTIVMALHELSSGVARTSRLGSFFTRIVHLANGRISA